MRRRRARISWRRGGRRRAAGRPERVPWRPFLERLQALAPFRLGETSVDHGYFDPAQRLKGIRLDLAEYRRPDPATAPVLAKAAGLYMICTISKHKAERKGYADAMMLEWQGRVAECTGANIFFVRDGRIHTPIADCFLDGITRRTVIDLARRRGMEVVERRIMPDELAQFSECFITGSAAEVTAVSEIAHWRFTPGSMTQQLMADYTAEVQPKGKKAAA